MIRFKPLQINDPDAVRLLLVINRMQQDLQRSIDSIVEHVNTTLPLAHATTHESGGDDVITLDELGAPSDVTTLNASATAHGLLPKLSADGSQYLDGNGGWTTPEDARIIVARLSSDHAITSGTATEVTGLKIAVPAAGTYVFRYYVICQTASTGEGIKLGVNYDGTIVRMVAHMRYVGTTTTAAGSVEDTVTATTGIVVEGAAARAKSTSAPNLGPTGAFAAANVDALIVVEGLIEVSDASDLELWHGCETGAAQTTVESGSSVEVVRTA